MIVKKVRMFGKPSETNNKKNSHQGPSNSFVFCEKSTGITHFQAQPAADANSTVERVAGLLAMQCLVRGHDPDDFMVLVPAEPAIVNRFRIRAKELLEEGRAVASPATLSPRQSEILLSVVRNRANKEIASRLNITVRTVKFHISSLLDKFGVDNRVQLARKATGFLRASAVQEGAAFQDLAMAGAGPEEFATLGPVSVDASLQVSERTRNARFTRRELSA